MVTASVVAAFVPLQSSVQLNYRFIIAIAIFLAFVIATLINMIVRLRREHYSNVRIYNCRRDNKGRVILLIKGNPAFYMDAIVTIYKTEESEDVSSKNKIKYELPFAIGFVLLIQDDGLAQIEIKDYFDECPKADRESLNKCDANIIKKLSVRPYAHIKYLEAAK